MELFPLVNKFEKTIMDATHDECPGLLGELERLKGLVLSKIFNPSVSRPNSPPVPMENLLTIEQVAERLNCPISRAYELARRSDGFPVIEIGKQKRVAPSALVLWLSRLQENGLDPRLDHRYSSRKHDRRPTQKTSGKPWPDPSGNGKKGRRRSQHSGPMGAGGPQNL